MKRRRDRLAREKCLPKAEPCLLVLNTKLNPRHLKDKGAIETAATAILHQHHLSVFTVIEVNTIQEVYQAQLSNGRPRKNTRHENRKRSIYTLSWRRQCSVFRDAVRVDGLFPLSSVLTPAPRPRVSYKPTNIKRESASASASSRAFTTQRRCCSRKCAGSRPTRFCIRTRGLLS